MLDGTESVLIGKAYRYWADKCRGRAAPSRADLDPIEMRAFLPHVVLVDVEQNPRRYRIRLIGTAFAKEYGEDLTGRYFDEINIGEGKQRLFSALDAAIAGCRPIHMRPMDHRLADDRVFRFERIVLPLTNDGETVNMLLICLVARETEKTLSGYPSVGFKAQ